MVVNIVDTDVPGSDTVFLLLVEVHAEVEAMVATQTEVVAFQCVDDRHSSPVVSQAFIDLGAEGAAVAAAEDPRAAEVDTIVELVLHGNAEVVTAVVFGGKHLALVDDHTLAVKLPLGMCPSVAYPTCGLAERTLHKELHTVGPAFTHADFVFPVLG